MWRWCGRDKNRGVEAKQYSSSPSRQTISTDRITPRKHDQPLQGHRCCTCLLVAPRPPTCELRVCQRQRDEQVPQLVIPLVLHKLYSLQSC